jgi:nucleoside-diphosphate-sugar epimerase
VRGREFRPFNWIGPGLDSLHAPKEGSSRVITQFLGHIVRGEQIRLVDGGHQERAFTYIDDGIEALVKIIANKNGVADGKIYNNGNPDNVLSIAALAEMMLKLAKTLPEYREAAERVDLIHVPAQSYYGNGYQDVLHRVPNIRNTMNDLQWSPRMGMHDALAAVFDYYRDHAAAEADLEA